MAGENFNLTNDLNILTLNSPKVNLKGPYLVVYKNVQERWAIVAFHWNNEPRLGIRWFWGNGGNPFSSGHPTWLVIPSSLSKGILVSLSIDDGLRSKVENFLAGKISGDDLII